MRKPERVLAAIAAAPVDYPPFSAWYHFGLQHLPGRALAEAELAFYRHFDPDFLKVMHDYPFPLPDGMTEVSRPEEWRRLTPLPGDHPAFREQLSALEAIGQGLKGEALFIDTVFSPWSTARRVRGQEGLLSDMRRHALGQHFYPLAAHIGVTVARELEVPERRVDAHERPRRRRVFGRRSPARRVVRL